MTGFICWVCRRKLKYPEVEGYARCTVCNKTREAKQPEVVKSQPPTKRERQKAVRQAQ